MADAAPEPNHALDGQSKVPEIISILTVCSVLTTLLVTLRVITRATLLRAFGADDWIIVVAQVRCHQRETRTELLLTRRARSWPLVPQWLSD